MTTKLLKSGDYVALLSNDYVQDPFSNVLGTIKPDGSRNIGRVYQCEKYCCRVIFGGEDKNEIYDPLSLGFVTVRLAPDAVTKNGVLGESSAKKVGIIDSWENYGLGKNVTIKTGKPGSAQTVTSVYPVSDLIFELNPYRSDYPLGFHFGGKRKTLRKGRVQRYLTRAIKRV